MTTRLIWEREIVCFFGQPTSYIRTRGGVGHRAQTLNVVENGCRAYPVLTRQRESPRRRVSGFLIALAISYLLDRDGGI